MKSLFRYLPVVLLIALLLPSCKTKNSIAKKGSANTYEGVADALLWKIEGKKLAQPSYLYGTIHIIDSEDYFLPSGTLAAMDNTDKMMFEIDMNEMSDMSNMMGVMMKAFMKDGLSLKDLITAADYELVNAHFQKMGLPLAMLERIKPMFLSAFAYGDMDPNSLQSGEMKSYEMEFFEMAQSAGKPVGGLETIDFQMGLFDSIPYKAQAEMLVETIKKADTSSDEFDKMTQMYTSQQISAMVAMIGDEDEQLSEHEDLLLGMRNRNWIPVMGEQMIAQPTFFAVGAGHLAGPQGVIHLLRQAGYTVSPISNKEVKKG